MSGRIRVGCACESVSGVLANPCRVCLRVLEMQKTGAEGRAGLIRRGQVLAWESLALPGQAGFPFNGFFDEPKTPAEVRLLSRIPVTSPDTVPVTSRRHGFMLCPWHVPSHIPSKNKTPTATPTSAARVIRQATSPSLARHEPQFSARVISQTCRVTSPTLP